MHQFIMYQARMLGKYRELNCSVDTTVENNGAPEMAPPTPQEMEALNDIDPLRFRDLETGES